MGACKYALSNSHTCVRASIAKSKDMPCQTCALADACPFKRTIAQPALFLAEPFASRKLSKHTIASPLHLYRDVLRVFVWLPVGVPLGGGVAVLTCAHVCADECKLTCADTLMW